MTDNGVPAERDVFIPSADETYRKVIKTQSITDRMLTYNGKLLAQRAVLILEKGHIGLQVVLSRVDPGGGRDWVRINEATVLSAVGVLFSKGYKIAGEHWTEAAVSVPKIGGGT